METETNEESLLKQKIKKPGVVYLNYIPRYMTVKTVREQLCQFGEVRRLFLKPEKSKKQGKPSKFFTEGWVEFAKRRIARQVAERLNGQQVGGRRHCPYYDALWSIKYLKKFQWSQLHEKKAYEKARKGQRMRAEIAQVKREVNFYSHGVEKTKRMRKSKEVLEGDRQTEEKGSSSEPSKHISPDSDDSSSAEDRNKLLLRKIFGNQD